MFYSSGLWQVVGLFAILLRYSFAQDELEIYDYNDNECGERLVKRQELVKGGYSTHPGDWPWHAALYHRGFNSRDFEYACGSTIVHRYLVITAAHCVTFATSRRKIPSDNMQLRLGRFNLMNNEEEYAEEFSVIDTIVHEGYRPTTLENDIAILRVEIPIIFNDYIQPVCLWKRDDGFDLPNVYNQPGTVVGWGLSENNRIGTTLNEAQMPVVNSWTCLASDRAFFGRFLQSKAFCAGYKNGTGVCNGDSGGGMFFQFQNRWYLKGIVSFSSVNDYSGWCNLRQYIGFTDASQYIDWVYENTPTSGNDDPILGHPNMRLINQGNCGRNEHMPEMDEDRKPILNQYPWMVALQAKTTTEYVPCNGVLLNRNYVLTAECYDLQYEITATLGDYDTSRTKDCGKVYGNMQCLSAVQTVSVSQFIRKDDLVLVRLSDPADIGRRQNIEAICLPVTPEQRIRLYNRYIMTGWKESGSDATILQRALLEAIDLNKCRAKFKGRIDSKTICVWNLEDPNRSVACNDYTPGSALQAIDQKSKRYLLYGVLRYISYCSVPEQYIAISEYLLWILDNIRR
ncbi:AGAP010635-PA [Anopheles gambiae str. PEST]|uniref:AGAP010635-PA n=1 Tax=Anopheles gambiae TaxID=7165 RepID=Q7QKH8_ANOGA|nr:AGAP010635-PA [Anopheles gambiae str. PEST]